VTDNGFAAGRSCRAYTDLADGICRGTALTGADRVGVRRQPGGRTDREPSAGGPDGQRMPPSAWDRPLRRKYS
jgi:hypothetical protein